MGNNKKTGASTDKVRVINKILDDQAYRGPDARGIWTDDSNKAVFGHNRLSIVELSEAGSQPMVSNDGRWVISYNGELYNYKTYVKDSKRNLEFHLRVIVIQKFFCMDLYISGLTSS